MSIASDNEFQPKRKTLTANRATVATVQKKKDLKQDSGSFALYLKECYFFLITAAIQLGA